ncbi:MAG: hypothetical protein IT327_07715 [Anaerolineae bacterium]|nr:hypothetical protein [Anaerolineae bacterium]
MRNTTQLDRIEMLLFAQSAAAGMVQWVSSWVAGENEGGVMVALYSDSGNFPACKVYSEKFHMLPDYVTGRVPQTAVPLPANRAAAEKAGRLVACRPFQIVRYAFDGEEKAKWRLAGVLRLGKEIEPAAVSQPATTQQPQQLSAAELAASFFRQGDKVTVQGKEGTRPGVVTGLGQDGKVAVKVDGVIYRMSPEKLTATDLA